LKSVPRILPLVGVAIGGVLVVNAISGARDLPGLLAGAQAFAQAATVDNPQGKTAATGEAKDAAAGLPAPSITPKAVCAPTAAELAKQAGLSPAELQVLQSLGARRGVLDARESDLSTQIALLAAAESKVDAKIKALNGLKAEMSGLLNQADTREAAEIDRLVKVFENMKAKDAAPRIVTLDDNVRIPIAAKMKERSLAAIIAQMPPSEAKKLTEALARRFSDAQAAAAKAQAAIEPPQQLAAAPKAATPPAKRPNAPPRKAAPAAQQAAATAPAADAAVTPPAPTPAPPAKTG